MKRFNLFLALIVVLGFAFTLKMDRPTLYLIGDSTVKNGDGTGKNNQMGWGTVIDAYFDTSKINIRNHAIGGRSSRTFVTEGRWQKTLASLKPGDYVIIQFGHNDSGPLDDTARARGSLRGIGEDSTEIYNPILKMQEVVHSYGWYLRQYIREARQKGATAIVCSPIPRNDWKDGKVIRSNTSYALWAEQVAQEEKVSFIPLNHLVALKYEEMGMEVVKPFFPVDHTHTNMDGAKLNAAIVAGAIRALAVNLKLFLL